MPDILPLEREAEKEPPRLTRNSGLIALLAAMFAWGLLPLYWNLLASEPPIIILCHRMFWSFIILLPATFLLGRKQEVWNALRSRKTIGILLLSGSLLACNWLLFIWGVLNGMVLETSLGYYINPLLNVCAGIVLFKDTPRRAQWVAIGLAVSGVACQILMLGYIPWVALGLAGSFTVYGLLRKIVTVESLPGMTLETALLMLPAASGILWSIMEGHSFLSGEAPIKDLLLIGAGPVTTFPLLWFAHAVRRVSLVTVGLLQYIAPTLTLLIGVFVLHEPFGLAHGVSFGFIWAGLALYTADALRRH